jgi:NAD(P)-dependent dehydrogenase (short-subunit alcohol dehydrogenase family)
MAYIPRLEGKRAIITGGASGLGAAIARRFAGEGAAVALIDLPNMAERGTGVADELNGAGALACFVTGDVLDAGSIRDAAKAAVWMLTRSLAAELAPHRIRVNAIGPAYVTTEMLAGIVSGAVGDDPEAQQAWYDQRAASLPLGVLPSPLDIANTALFLCSDEAASFTGSILHPDGGLTSATGGG